MVNMRVSDYISTFLYERGCRHVFMVTGGGSMHLNDAFGKSDLNCVFNNHEQACAMAAESYYRSSNIPAVVNVTSGPGGTNAITGVYGAWVDSAAMIVVSGQVKRETTISNMRLRGLRQLGDQELDIVPLIESITKYSKRIENKNEIRYVLEKAWIEATTGRPGPVWIDVPLDIQSTLIEEENLFGYEEFRHNNNQVELSLDRKVISVIKKLKEAKRPVIYVGTGVHLSEQKNAILQFCELNNIPIVTAWNSNDIVPSDHPCAAGRGGTVGDRAGNFALQNSDLMLILGNRLNIRLISYNWENFAPNSYKIMVDIDPNELNKPTISIDLPIQSDLKDFIPKLTKNILTDMAIDKKWLAHCQKNVKQFHSSNEIRSADIEGFVNPYSFMNELSNYLLEDETIVTGDGTACVASFQAFEIKKNQRLYTNSGCASMGYDLPAAIGAHYATNRRVICLAGDGSIMMNLQELSTIANRKLPIKIFILNNDGYHSIRQTQEAYFPEGLMGYDGKTGISLPCFKKIVEGFDLKYSHIRKFSDIKRIMKLIDEDSSPEVIEVFLNPNQLFSPKLSSKKLKDGTMISAIPDDMYPFLDSEELESGRFN